MIRYNQIFQGEIVRQKRVELQTHGANPAVKILAANLLEVHLLEVQHHEVKAAVVTLAQENMELIAALPESQRVEPASVDEIVKAN